MSDACQRSNVSLEVFHNNAESHRPLEIGKEFEYNVIYKNTGDVSIENAEIRTTKLDYKMDDNVASVNYKDFNITCEATNGAVCPESQILQQYGSQVVASSGKWTYVEKNSTTRHRYNLFDTVIPLLPAHSELRMKVRYTISDVDLQQVVP